MNRAARIRAAIGLALLAIPYLLPFAAGSVWLYQYHALLGWAVLALTCTAIGLLLLRDLRHAVRPAKVRPDLAWPPQGTAIWPQIEQLAAQIELEDIPLDQPEKLAAVVRRVLELVARHYHPSAAEPWLETPLPDVLRVVELVARDLRKAALAYVPGTHIFTIGDLRRLQKLAGMARRTYLWYRIASFVINGPAAFLREGREALFGRLQDLSAETAKRMAVGYCVRRAGYYAIQLYGRQFAPDDAPPDGKPLMQSLDNSREDARRTAALEKEPLRIMVAGQAKSGKSSLVNALFGEERAATDVVPRTDQVEPYVLVRDGLQQAIVLDTAGYDCAVECAAGASKPLRALVDCARACDIVLCVCSAATAAREADRRFLSELRAEFQRTPDRHPPVVLVALTHIDRLRPVQEWSSPYRLDPPEGRKAREIADAVEAVAADLGLPPADVIPVCTLAGRLYNVDEALIPTVLAALPAAERVKYVRCLRQRRDEEHWQRLWRQTLGAGRVLRSWIGGQSR
jgi:predicted GTPase